MTERINTFDISSLAAIEASQGGAKRVLTEHLEPLTNRAGIVAHRIQASNPWLR